MDVKLLLIYCMTLLYKESRTPQQERSVALCQTIYNAIIIPENSFALHTTREITIGLKATLNWMLSQSENEYNEAQLLQRIRVVTRDESYLYNAFVDGIECDQGDVEASKKHILTYRAQLRDYINRHKVQGIISDAYMDITRNGDEPLPYKELAQRVYQQLEPYLLSIHDHIHPSVMDKVNFDEPDELERIFDQSVKETEEAGILKTGYQAINRMLGNVGGFRRGEMAVIGALQHQYKSGFALNLFKHMALYNTPYMRDPEKKPLLLHLSLENELPLNLSLLYKSLIENETGEECKLKTIDPVKAAPYVQKRLSENGYSIEMVRLEPGKCTVNDLFEMLLKYESKGYEIHGIVCDYLNMMSKQGLGAGGPAGEDIRELFRRVRNFCAPRGITFITPHQLSTEAKMLTRAGVEHFVKDIANKGYYDGSKRIDQEVDLEIYIHIVKVVKGKGSTSYLTCQRGKHRTLEVTKDHLLYTVLPFRDAGGVIDDIHIEDQSMKSVGGNKDLDWYDRQ